MEKKEKIKAFKDEAENSNKKFQELTIEELTEVSGGDTNIAQGVIYPGIASGGGL